MPFPFLPLGAALALAVLGGAFALFGLLLRLADRAALAARDSVASGLVAGLRRWGMDAGRPAPISSPVAGEAALGAFVFPRGPGPSSGPGGGATPDEPDAAPGALIEELTGPASTEVFLQRLHRG